MQSQRVFLRLGMAVGGVITGAALLSLCWTVLGMWRAFHVLGQNGISDPHGLASTIATTLLATASGVFLLPGGLALLVVCSLLLRRLRSTGPPPLPRFLEDPQDVQNRG